MAILTNLVNIAGPQSGSWQNLGNSSPHRVARHSPQYNLSRLTPDELASTPMVDAAWRTAGGDGIH